MQYSDEVCAILCQPCHEVTRRCRFIVDVRVSRGRVRVSKPNRRSSHENDPPLCVHVEIDDIIGTKFLLTVLEQGIHRVCGEESYPSGVEMVTCARLLGGALVCLVPDTRRRRAAIEAAIDPERGSLLCWGMLGNNASEHAKDVQCVDLHSFQSAVTDISPGDEFYLVMFPAYGNCTSHFPGHAVIIDSLPRNLKDLRPVEVDEKDMEYFGLTQRYGRVRLRPDQETVVTAIQTGWDNTRTWRKNHPRAMVRHDRLVCVTGASATGKTTATEMALVDSMRHSRQGETVFLMETRDARRQCAERLMALDAPEPKIWIAVLGDQRGDLEEKLMAHNAKVERERRIVEANNDLAQRNGRGRHGVDALIGRVPSAQVVIETRHRFFGNAVLDKIWCDALVVDDAQTLWRHEYQMVMNSSTDALLVVVGDDLRAGARGRRNLVGTVRDMWGSAACERMSMRNLHLVEHFDAPVAVTEFLKTSGARELVPAERLEVKERPAVPGRLPHTMASSAVVLMVGRPRKTLELDFKKEMAVLWWAIQQRQLPRNKSAVLVTEDVRASYARGTMRHVVRLRSGMDRFASDGRAVVDQHLKSVRQMTGSRFDVVVYFKTARTSVAEQAEAVRTVMGSAREQIALVVTDDEAAAVLTVLGAAVDAVMTYGTIVKCRRGGKEGRWTLTPSAGAPRVVDWEISDFWENPGTGDVRAW